MTVSFSTFNTSVNLTFTVHRHLISLIIFFVSAKFPLLNLTT